MHLLLVILLLIDDSVLLIKCLLNKEEQHKPRILDVISPGYQPSEEVQIKINIDKVRQVATWTHVSVRINCIQYYTRKGLHQTLYYKHIPKIVFRDLYNVM